MYYTIVLHSWIYYKTNSDKVIEISLRPVSSPYWVSWAPPEGLKGLMKPNLVVHSVNRSGSGVEMTGPPLHKVVQISVRPECSPDLIFASLGSRKPVAVRTLNEYQPAEAHWKIIFNNFDSSTEGSDRQAKRRLNQLTQNKFIRGALKAFIEKLVHSRITEEKYLNVHLVSAVVFRSFTETVMTRSSI